MQQEPNDFNSIHYYLAQLTAEVRRSWVNKPKEVSVQDFLIKFEITEDRPLTTDEKKAKASNSKSAWAALLGPMKKSNKPKNKNARSRHR